MQLLLVGDIHLSFTNIKKLADWADKNIDSLDFILVNGDVCNMIHGEPNDSDADALQQFTIIMNDFKTNPSFKGARVIYLPGNHDPKELFEEDSGDINLNAVGGHLNLHMKSTYLHSRSISCDLLETKGLLLVGFGGSVPGFYKDSMEMAFSGFPFKDDEQFDKQMATLYSQCKQRIDECNSYILLTHNGPATSSTTLKGNDILMGSNALFNKINSDANRILLHIHGHSHEGWGVAQLSSPSVPVVNPGALKDGRFGMVEIVDANEGSGKYRVASINFYLL